MKVQLRVVTVWRCPLPMPRTLTLGRMTSAAREYVVVRLEAEDGATGVAVGYTRGTPLLEATALLCTALDPGVGWVPQDQHADLRARFGSGWGAMVRAGSLIDIALWDLQGGLGATPTQASSPPAIMAVAGYFADTRPLKQVAAEAQRLVEDGASIVKVMVPGVDTHRDREIFAEVASAVAGRARLGVDLHGTAASVDHALRAAEQFAGMGAEFLEDPFPGHPLRDLSRYAASGALPLAVGEDLIESTLVQELVEIAAYLRIDATASGGYSFALGALRTAEEAGISVLPHVFPATHAPLSQVSRAVEALEVIPEYVGAEPIDRILDPSRTSPFDPLAFDWQAVESTAAAQWSRDFT